MNTVPLPTALRTSMAPPRDVARLDDELPAVRHRVARVEREIQNHLLDLTGIGDDLSPRIQHRGKLDSLAERRRKDAAHAVRHVVQIECGGVQHLTGGCTRGAAV